MYLSSNPLNIGMFFAQQPAHVGEEKASLWIDGVSIGLRVLVVDAVVWKVIILFLFSKIYFRKFISKLIPRAHS